MHSTKDKELLNEVKGYLQKFIDLKVLELTYERKETKYLADAKDFLDGAGLVGVELGPAG